MKKLLMVFVVVAGIAAGFAPSTAMAASDPASTLVRLINAERARAGRPALAVNAELVAYGYRHSREMAAADQIYHTRHPSQAVSVGTVVGENVGDGSSAQDLHSMFMASPEHRANILDGDYSYVGVGYAWRDGWLYVTEMFAGSPGHVHRAPPKPVVHSAPPPAITNAAIAGAQNQLSILGQLQALDIREGASDAPIRIGLRSTSLP